MGRVRSQLSAFRSLALVAVTACSFGDVDLTGRACPCVEGWICVSGTCVRAGGDGGMDGATPDASRDGGRDANFDAGARDSATLDAAGPDGSGDAQADAGPVDSGRLDSAAPADSGTDAGPPSACDNALSGVLFCDGFEAPTLFPWEIGTVTGAEVSRAIDPVYRGAGALRATLTVPGSRNANVSTSFPSAVTAGPLAARVYMRIPSGQSFDFLAFLSLTESQDPFGAVNVRLVSGPSLEVQARVNETISTTRSSAAVLPTDQWLCLQVSVNVSATAGAVSVFLDGTALVTMTDVPTLPAGGYDAMVIGVNFSVPAQPPAALFFDEAAVDTTASIPCDP